MEQIVLYNFITLGWLIPAIVAAGLLIAGCVIYSKTKKSIYAVRQKEKQAALDKYLKEHGPALPDSENPAIDKS